MYTVYSINCIDANTMDVSWLGLSDSFVTGDFPEKTGISRLPDGDESVKAYVLAKDSAIVTRSRLGLGTVTRFLDHVSTVPAFEKMHGYPLMHPIFGSGRPFAGDMVDGDNALFAPDSSLIGPVVRLGCNLPASAAAGEILGQRTVRRHDVPGSAWVSHNVCFVPWMGERNLVASSSERINIVEHNPMVGMRLALSELVLSRRYFLVVAEDRMSVYRGAWRMSDGAPGTFQCLTSRDSVKHKMTLDRCVQFAVYAKASMDHLALDKGGLDMRSMAYATLSEFIKGLLMD